MKSLTRKSLPWIISAVVLLTLGSAIFAMLPAWPAPFGPPEATKAITTDQQPAGPERPVDTSQQSDAGRSAGEPGVSITRSPVPQMEPSVIPAMVAIEPLTDWNPIKTQHTFTVTVSDEEGQPADGIEVELMLNRSGEAVGDIVSLGGENPRKVDNSFGRAITDESGQTTLTITATRAGYTDVTAYVPQIEDADAHKVFAVKNWVDMQVSFPEDAVNLVGTDHPMQVRISRASDGTPLEGVEVLWSIVDDDPDATINTMDERAVTKTDDLGIASATLRQVAPTIGDNQVAVEVVHESGTVIFENTVTKEWKAPSLEVDKSAPQTVGLFKTGEFEVVVTNTGNRVASGVTLTDTLPFGLEFVSSIPEAASVNESTVNWDLGDLEPGSSATITMVLRGTLVGDQLNRATAVSTEGFAGADDATTEVEPGTLTVSKSASAQVNIGEEITYVIMVENEGDGALTNVVITDTLPEGAALTSVTPETASGLASPVIWSIDRLDAGSSRTYRITATAQTVGRLVNSVTATSEEGAEASAEATTLSVAPELSLEKTADTDTVLVGEQVTFTVTATNAGSGTADNLMVYDQLPEGLELVSSRPEADNVNGSLSWNIEALEADESRTFTVVAVPAAGGQFTNEARLTYGESSWTAEATITALTPELRLAKTGGSVMYIGGQRTYTLTAVNIGEADLTGVIITDTFPETMSYISDENEGVVSGNTVTWAVGDLPVGEAVGVTLTLRGDVASEVVNQAEATSDQGATAEAEMDISILAAAGAHLQIIDNIDPLGVGDEVSYTITVRNQSGATSINNVRVTVEIPVELEIIEADGGVINAGRITYAPIGSLGGGQQQIFVIQVRAIQAGDVVASATMSYDQFDRPITDQEGTTIIDR